MIASRVSVPVRLMWEVVRPDGSQVGSRGPHLNQLSRTCLLVAAIVGAGLYSSGSVASVSSGCCCRLTRVRW